MESANALRRKLSTARGRFVARSVVSIAFGVICLGLQAAAQTPSPWPAISLTKAQEKRFSVVTHFQFWEMQYDPSVTIKPSEHQPGWYQSPEDALFAMVSSMKALDFDGYLSTWDADAKRRILARDQAEGHSKDFWIAQWKQTFASADAKLVRRIEFDEYVILTYRLYTGAGAGVPKSGEYPLAFHLSGGAWTATEDLADSPILLAAGTGKSRFERVVR